MSDTEKPEPEHVYMLELEEELDRGRSTIRSWERNEWLPAELLPHRDENGWRYWTRAQVEQIKEWMAGRNQGRSVSRHRE